ncbi:MAG: GGDEF domain-containing protein, partial [Lachnospiraceae bacterium]|nr:GGDEF domain-containing protein [Lachnospiraceae bacterium]
MTGVNLLEIFIANGMGLMLMYGVLVGNAFGMQKEAESRMLYFMAIILVDCCAIDPIVFYYDGKPGKFIPFVLYSGNFLLYLSNLLFGPTFLFLVERHTFGKNSKLLRRIIAVIDMVLAVVLIINFFHPIIFYIDEANCYQRLPMFFLYTAAGMSFTVMALVIYIISRVRGRFYKSFPVFELVAPIFLGLLVQSKFYGVSLIWPATAVGLTLMVLSIQNRNIVLDPLTGLYNRKYLDSFKFRDKNYCLMMLDLNGFKAINDTYGHSEGDVALQKIAELLLTTIGMKGTAVRYAGDEFIVLLNTD